MNTQSDNVIEGQADLAASEVDDVLEDDLHDDDLDFAPSARAGLGRLTTVLLAGIALVAAFGGGAYVQKHHGGTAAAPSAPAGFNRAMSGEGGFMGAPGGTSGAGTTGSGSTGSGSSAASAASTPVVIGTVVKVSGTTVTVRNIAGKTVKVTVPAGVTVTKAQTITSDDLKKGASVTVTGTTAADGSVTATGVTAR